MKSNDTYLNILVSYAYLAKSNSFLAKSLELSQSGKANVMIDSGAFTLFNAKANRDWLTVDNYCDFLDKHGHKVEKYVMLDVIGQDEESKQNYETMLNRGLNPMFVFTMADNDYNYLQYAAKQNEHICVAGGVTTKSDWIRKRFQDVYKQTNAKIHGLGYVKYPDMMKLPLHSVDSSSWKQAPLMFGNLMYFDNGLKGTRYMDVLKREKPLPFQLRLLLEKIKVSPKDFSNLDNHKGNHSIAMYCGLIANLEYQKLAKSKGLNMFLAASNETDLNKIISVNNDLENNKLNFHKFKKQ